MIDWTKPIEAVHDNGTVVPVQLSDPNPDREGDYCIVDVLRGDGPEEPGPAVFMPNGRPWIDEDWANVWTIRNVGDKA